MRSYSPLVSSCVLACVARIAICNEPAADEAPPVTIECQGVNRIKWPIHDLRITLVNRNDWPVWFVVPASTRTSRFRRAGA